MIRIVMDISISLILTFVNRPQSVVVIEYHLLLYKELLSRQIGMVDLQVRTVIFKILYLIHLLQQRYRY